ncbi:MAG: ABC transporter permease [Bifidobacteriaceae bacterium]|nr:ABC transporter permease [Bifidobacteriaceae bacterium]
MLRTSSEIVPRDKFYTPGSSRGFLDLVNQRFLLKLLVAKEVKVRYRGSYLGQVWTYIKPFVLFLIYFMFVGYVMGGNDRVYNFGIYLFAGLSLVQFFNEVFRNCTISLRSNAALVRKIYLPRELFPIAAWRVALTHFIPQFVILLVASFVIAFSSHPVNLFFLDFKHILAFCLGILLISLFAIGAGMIFATINVFYRDAENLVEVITMCSTWISPVLYDYRLFSEIAPHWFYNIFMCSPISAAVELFHYAFVYDRNFRGDRWAIPVHWVYAANFIPYTLIAFGISGVFLVVGQILFHRFEGRFAQEL